MKEEFNDSNEGDNNVVGRLTKEEHLCFIKGNLQVHSILAIQKYGTKWPLISKEIPKRTSSQIRTHAQKFFIKVSNILPDDSEIIPFLQSKPAEFFANLPSHLASKKPDSFEDKQNPIPKKNSPTSISIK